MKKNNVWLKTGLKFLLFGILFSWVNPLMAQYASPAGQLGSTAVHKDSSVNKTWAFGVEIHRGLVNISDPLVTYNGSNRATYGYPSYALGKATGSSANAVSLGDGGVATLTFDRPLVNGPGVDFAIFENSFSDTHLELAFVDVSSDGKRFVRLPALSLTPSATQVGGFGEVDATLIHNLAGKYRQGYGTPFDLDDIKDSVGINLNNIRFVRLTDVVGNILPPYATYDSKGNIINDPWPTPFHSCGFDLEAASLFHTGQPYAVATFEELTISPDSYWNGSDNSGGFTSGPGFFVNRYDTVFGSWIGFGYSTMRDDSTAGFINQYSAWTGGGMSANETEGTTYAIANIMVDFMNGKTIPSEIHFQNSHLVSGFYVANSTFGALSMKNGDAFAKKFGGASGNDPDFLKLLVWGETPGGAPTDTVEFYLADYRFDDNTEDYIAEDWYWVDLLTLGKVKKLYLDLLSTDVGDFGMNTPAVICLENLTLLPEDRPYLVAAIGDIHVGMNAADKAFPVYQYFTAYQLSDIFLSILSNSNPELVTAQLTDENLTLTFAPDMTGTAEISAKAEANGLEVVESFTVHVSHLLNSQVSLASTVSVYPNPFRELLIVKCGSGSRVALFDALGRKVDGQLACGEIVNLDTRGLEPGYYLLQSTSGNNVQVTRVLKH